MKKIISMLLVILLLAFIVGCGKSMYMDGKLYGTYGFINKSEKRSPDIEYELIIGNIIWSAILYQTIFAPIYFLGFSIYEPVGKKNYNASGEVIE